MRLSMRWRIAIPYIAVVLVSTVLLNLYLSHQLGRSLIREDETRLLAEASLLGSVISDHITELQSNEHLQNQANEWSQALGLRVTLISAEGVVLADSHADTALLDNHINRPEIVQAKAAGHGSSIRYSDSVDYEMLYVALSLPEGPSGIRFVRVSLPLRDIHASLHRIQGILGIASIVTLVAVVAVSIFISERITRPLRRLTSAVQNYATRQIPRSGTEDSTTTQADYDEVQKLAIAFDSMAGEISRRVEGLAEERNRLSTVLAQLTDGILITDPNGTIVLFNSAAKRLLGFPPSTDLTGQHLESVVEEEEIIDVWQRSHNSGEEQQAMIEVPNKDAFLRVISKPNSNTSPAGETLVLQDLTQVRRLETVRRDFISNISHELRTPLASLKALVETLQDGALDDPAAATGFLQRMAIEVDALTQMVQELLELSRIESGQVPIRMSEVDITELIHDPLERLQLQAERSHLALAVNLPPETINVIADSERMKQVITNIVHNAIKFTPGGGRITISAATAGDEVVVSVADTGIGIPQKDLPRIFERFYKADRARSSGGTGLGLAIAKHIVQAHGGRIWAESREGLGSTFYFTLPAAR